MGFVSSFRCYRSGRENMEGFSIYRMALFYCQISGRIELVLPTAPLVSHYRLWLAEYSLRRP